MVIDIEHIETIHYRKIAGKNLGEIVDKDDKVMHELSKKFPFERKLAYYFALGSKSREPVLSMLVNALYEIAAKSDDEYAVAEAKIALQNLLKEGSQ